MSLRKLRSRKKPKQGRVPTPLWFQRSDLFDAEFDSDGEKNATEVLSKRKSKGGRSEMSKEAVEVDDLKPLNILNAGRLNRISIDEKLDEDSDNSYKSAEMDSDSDIEWLPDLPDDSVPRQTSPKRTNHDDNKRKSEVIIVDDDPCTCSKSTGNTKIMCKSCRLSPPAKKLRFIDLTSPTKTEDNDVIVIDSTPEKESHFKRKEPSAKRYNFNLRNISERKSKTLGNICAGDGDSWPGRTDVSALIDDSGPRHVRAETRNKRVNSPYHGEDDRTLSGDPSPRLPCLLGTSHASIFNPVKKYDQRKILPYDVTKLYTIQACQPDYEKPTRKQNLDLLKMVRDFCTRKEEPPNELIRSLLQLLIDTQDDKFAIKVHRCLFEIMEINPPVKRNGSTELPFDWKMIDNIMGKLNLNMAVFDKFRSSSPATTLANTLALDYTVSHLESDLVHRPLGKQMQIYKSAAAAFFNEPHDQIRKVIKYLQMAIISYNEYDQLLIERLSLDRSDSEYRFPLTDIEKVVPLLQRLLDLYITISLKFPSETVNEVITHLKHVWRMCCMEKRKLLLKTLVSPLVKLKLVHLILMDTNGAVGDDVPRSFDSMHDIVSFFRAVGPFCVGPADTPPTSPRSPNEENPAGHNDAEEIAMLLYTAVTSYIAVVKGNLRTATHNRYLEAHNKHDLSDSDMREIRRLDTKIEELYGRLQSIVGSGMALSSRTTMYLEQMRCIQDWHHPSMIPLPEDVIVL